jgi:hypothetical protein
MEDFSFLQLKSEAIVSLHRHANIIDRRSFTFEIHGATSMGKMLVPGDVIMVTFMTINGHGNCAIINLSQGKCRPSPPNRVIDSQIHILQHTPGPLSFLIISRFRAFNHGLNDIVTDPFVFKIDDILGAHMAVRLG